MKLHFAKMHGLGNDFMVLDGVSQSIKLNSHKIKQWSDRHRGVGFDQLLLIEPPREPDCDFYYRIFNADGKEVGTCGNGARCIALFIQQQQLSHKKKLQVATSEGQLTLEILSRQQIKVLMGIPQFEPAKIPFIADNEAATYQVAIQGAGRVKFSVVSLGNPHAVITVNDLDQAPVQKVGSAFQQLPEFPEQVNVGFMQIITPQHIRLRVYERGVGETLACGSGACAAAASGIQRGLLQSPVQVDLPGGSLEIRWPALDKSLAMLGPAVYVFDGALNVT